MLLEGENEFLVSEIFTQRPGVDNEDKSSYFRVKLKRIRFDPILNQTGPELDSKSPSKFCLKSPLKSPSKSPSKSSSKSTSESPSKYPFRSPSKSPLNTLLKTP